MYSIPITILGCVLILAGGSSIRNIGKRRSTIVVASMISILVWLAGVLTVCYGVAGEL